MRKICLPFIACFLASCATSGTEMQAECEAKFREFPEIFQCTYDAVASRNPGILKDARAKLYLLKGEQLTREVTEKKISSLDAKVAWQRLYVELKTAKEQEVAESLSSLSRSLESARSRAASPAPTMSVNCTSTRLGSSVQTTCQ